jgi:hypothetical protein
LCIERVRQECQVDRQLSPTLQKDEPERYIQNRVVLSSRSTIDGTLREHEHSESLPVSSVIVINLAAQGHGT